MQGLAFNRPPQGPVLDYALVLEQNGPEWIIDWEGEHFLARKAVSCLIKPQPGDTVLASFDPAGHAYVVAVLERSDSRNGTEMELSGPVALKIHQGGFSVSADQNLDLTAGSEINLAANRLGVSALEGQAEFNRVSLVGRFVNTQAEKIRQVAESCDQFFSRLTQRLTESFRFVKENDEIQAGTARRIVEGTLTVQSKNAVHLAEEDVKIDAEQIHLG